MAAVTINAARSFSSRSVSLDITTGAGDDLTFTAIADYLFNTGGAGANVVSGPATFPNPIPLGGAANTQEGYALQRNPLYAFLRSTVTAGGTTINTVPLTLQWMEENGVSVSLVSDTTATTLPFIQASKSFRLPVPATNAALRISIASSISA